MSDEIDPSRPRWHGEPGTTRRTWVRAAANAAWSVPLVSVATSAPALAAASTTTSDGLAFVSATFYLWTLGPYTCLDPLITVTNPTTKDTGLVSVVLQFSTTDFTGANTSLQPPTPSYVDLPIPSSDNTWAVDTLATAKTDTVVSVRLRRDIGLAAGETSTVGGAVNKSVPFGICFANKPTVTTVPLLLETSTAGYPVTPGTMLLVPRPT